jgi:hypothetical protein
VTDPAKFRKYFHDVLRHLSNEEKGVMESVLSRYSYVFHLDKNSPFKGTDLVEHHIVTGDGWKAPYRVPFALRQEMETQVKDMLMKVVIEPSHSPWGAVALLVPKKSLYGKPKDRFCVDVHALNKITTFDNYPLSVFDETVSTLHGSRYFLVIDLYSGFWQIKIAE